MRRFAIAALAAAWLAAPAAAQQDLSEVEIRAEHAGGNVHVLFGAGGNIGVLRAPDGVVLIDDQFAPLTEKILAAVKAIDPRPIRFLINTHWHGDHTGGNENLGAAGVLIVAHDHVRERLANPQTFSNAARNTRARPAEALPVVTFKDEVALHLGEEARAHHVPHAHTDGDSIVHFTGSNVLHMGDTFFNGRYPFVDIESGGNLLGMIDAARFALGLADEATAIIPGHGPLARRGDLEAWLAVLETAVERVDVLIAEGKSLEEIVAARPMAEFDEAYGSGFIGPERFLGIVHASLVEAGHRH